jgi:Amidohydrolase
MGDSTMRYQLNDRDRHVKTIAVEEHFSTPMQTQKSSPDAFRDFYLSTRSKYIGHNIVEQLADLDEQRLAYMKENMVVTTSGNWFEPTFVCTLLALGADNILFAVDWPFEPNTTAMEFLNRMPISDLDREKIAHLNAERILRM